MAKTQRYFENNKLEHYEDGPWVLCGPFPDGTFRIERLNCNAPCSTFPSSAGSEHQLKIALKGAGLHWERGSFERLAPIVDMLNGKVE